MVCEDTVCLPRKKEMRRRLQYVRALNPAFFFREVYSLLLKHAGEEKTAEEIAEMLRSTITECLRGIRRMQAKRAYDMGQLLIYELVDNTSVREAARAAYDAERAIDCNRRDAYIMQSKPSKQENLSMLHEMILLPLEEEMRNRLFEADFDFFYREMLYPKLLKKAGCQVTAEGLARLFQLSIFECTLGMPREINEKVCTKVPNFMQALIDDKMFVAEAELIFKRERQAANDSVK